MGGLTYVLAWYPVEAFPENDVFGPLPADPKQPQFFASRQAPLVGTNHTSINADRWASVITLMCLSFLASVQASRASRSF
jgi:hypothetical protein